MMQMSENEIPSTVNVALNAPQWLFHRLNLHARNKTEALCMICYHQEFQK